MQGLIEGSPLTPDRASPPDPCYVTQARFGRVHMDCHITGALPARELIKTPTGNSSHEGSWEGEKCCLLQSKANTFIVSLARAPPSSTWGAQQGGLKAQQRVTFFSEVLVPQSRKNRDEELPRKREKQKEDFVRSFHIQILYY